MSRRDMAPTINRRSLLAALAAVTPALAEAKEHRKHRGKKHQRPNGKRKHTRAKGSVRVRTALVAASPADGVIVYRYGRNASNQIDQYRPRQFSVGLVRPDAQRATTWKLTDAGAYNAWDAFTFGTTGGHTREISTNWATYELARPATIGYVQRDPGAPPPWIAADGWVQQGTVTAQRQDNQTSQTWKVYRKSFGAGTATIKSPAYDANARILPWILFAEANGTASPAPSVPAGNAEPKPNQLCPAWLHDSITVPGRVLTTQQFPTWHPAIDYGRYHCYYGQEHGSDWRSVNTDPTTAPRYGEVAALMGMTENHWGHKNYAITLADGKHLLVVHHFGTTGVKRANTCLQQFHLLEMKLFDASRTERLIDVGFMADFGASYGCQQGDNGRCDLVLKPSACPNGNAALGYPNKGRGSRQIPVSPFGLTDQAYEPWIADIARLVLGFRGQGVVPNTTDQVDICEGQVCDVGVRTAHGTGTGRFLTFDAALGPNGTLIPFGLTDPGHARDASGYFYTNATATQVVAKGTAGAVPQFVKAGLDWKMSLDSTALERGHMGGKNVSMWGDEVVRVPTGEAGDPEGSILWARDQPGWGGN